MQDSDSSIIDWDIFARARAEMGPGFIRILGYFREDGETAIERIEQAMRRRDAAALVRPAQTLESGAHELGAAPLSELAETIETTARRAIEMRVFPDELIPAVSRLRPLYRETVDLVEREVNPLAERRRAQG